MHECVQGRDIRLFVPRATPSLLQRHPEPAEQSAGLVEPVLLVIKHGEPASESAAVWVHPRLKAVVNEGDVGCV